VIVECLTAVTGVVLPYSRCEGTQQRVEAWRRERVEDEDMEPVPICLSWYLQLEQYMMVFTIGWMMSLPDVIVGAAVLFFLPEFELSHLYLYLIAVGLPIATSLLHFVDMFALIPVLRMVLQCPAGTYPLNSHRWLIHGWLAHELLQLSDSHFSTLTLTFWPNLYARALGADIHPTYRCATDMGTLVANPPNLMRIEQNCMTVQDVNLGEGDVEDGHWTVKPVCMGEGSFIGNVGQLSPGVKLPPYSIIGAVTTVHEKGYAHGPHEEPSRNLVGERAEYNELKLAHDASGAVFVGVPAQVSPFANESWLAIQQLEAAAAEDKDGGGKRSHRQRRRRSSGAPAAVADLADASKLAESTPREQCQPSGRSIRDEYAGPSQYTLWSTVDPLATMLLMGLLESFGLACSTWPLFFAPGEWLTDDLYEEDVFWGAFWIVALASIPMFFLYEIFYTAAMIASKWMLLGRIRAGQYSIDSWFTVQSKMSVAQQRRRRLADERLQRHRMC
jgi:hypothetical protein